MDTTVAWEKNLQRARMNHDLAARVKGSLLSARHATYVQAVFELRRA
jgi:hypothetical protein